MSPGLRLAGYARRYWGLLALSFILMAVILALVAIYARVLGTEKLTG